MKNIVIGKITEFTRDSKVRYRVNFYDSYLRQEFDSKEDMLDFISSEAKALFSFKENKIAAIKYKNLKSQSHYFVIKDTGEEVVVGEQSKFEFQEAQSHLFGKYVNKRQINDRHYDFMDIVRSAANFNILSMWAKLLLIFLTAAASMVVSVDILNMFNDDLKEAEGIHKATYISLCLANTIFAVTVLITSFISTYYAVRVYTEENGENKYFDFRKATLKRQLYRKINLFFQIVSISCLIALSIVSENDGFFKTLNSLSVLLITNLSIGFVAFIMQITYITLVHVNLRKIFKHYYPMAKYNTFLKWFKTGKGHELVGKQDIFLLSDEESIAFYTMELESINSLRKKDTRREIKVYEKKIRTQLKTAVEKRKYQMVQVKVEKNDNISENNW